MKTLLLLILITSTSIYAQSYQFEVIFKDKDSAKYATSIPTDFLTSKSIARKNKHLVPITVNDYPVNSSYLDSLNKHFNVRVVSKWFNLSVVQTNDSLSIDTLKNFPFVASFKFIGKSGFSVSRTKTGTTEIDYGVASTAVNQLKGEYLHSNNLLGEGITIAILDAGFTNVNNMDIFTPLYSELRILAEKNFISPSNDIYGFNVHGTQVLSVLAGNKDGEYVGSAPKANYILLITEDVREENLIEEYFWTQGAEYADSLGADIISSSLGYNTFDTKSFDHLQSELGKTTAMVSKGARSAVQKGMLVVNSAGNEGESPWEHLLFPADEELVLTVGAVNSQGNHVNFSSTSPPGLGFVKPNVAALGEQISISSSNGIYENANGTSFACPIISGLAACLWQAYPDKNQLEIKTIIEQSAHQYNSPDNLIGYGIPNFSQTIENISLQYKQVYSTTLFPNPTSNSKLTLKHQFNDSILNIELFDYTGKQMKTVLFEKINSETIGITLPTIQQGSYFLTFITEAGLFQKQLIVN
ncbi:MAG: serine protease AprX [Saprospiraceae bacterium]